VGWCLSPILFTLYREYLTKGAFEGVGDFKSEGQVIAKMKYVDKLVLGSKKEKLLQDMFHRLTEIGRFCGLEMHVKESKVSNGNLTVTISITEYGIPNQLGNMEYFNYLGSMLNK